MKINYQIPIKDGVGSGGRFIMAPIKPYDFYRENNYWSAFSKNSDTIFNIDEEYFKLVFPFLVPYFDSQLNEIRSNGLPYKYRPIKEEFDWWDINLYECSVLKEIIQNIRNQYPLLKQHQYEQLPLYILENFKSVLKYYIPPSCYDPEITDEYQSLYLEITEQDINENIDILIDFFERFCCRLEKMMKNAPYNYLIGFEGP